MKRRLQDLAREACSRFWKNRSKFVDGGLDAAGGMVKEGAFGAIDSASYFLYSDKALQELLAREEGLREEYRTLVLDQQAHWRRVDTLTLGGALLVDLLAGPSVPPEIEAAFGLAYPGLAAEQSFSEAAMALDAEQLTGLLSAVKGKLFEVRYAELLNEELLPPGYTAELAESPNQPGWDIAIQGPDGQVAEVLQAKATDSVSYVREALEAYPEIDVVTTDEVYSQLMLSGGAEGLIRSGIENAQLDEALAGAVEAGGELDFAPPVLAMALIGMTTVAFEEGGVSHKARVIGRRCGRAYPAWMVGKFVAAMSGPLWWLSIPSGMGVRYVADGGRIRRRAWRELRRRARSHEQVLMRFRGA